jgi:hypothetical protein
MTLQGSGPISLNVIHQEAAGFTGAVAVEVKPISGNYTLRTNNDWTSVKVWAIGGGGSGGAASTNSGREKVATGGGAGGTAVRTYYRSSGISSFSATIGSGGASVSAIGVAGRRSGRSGGTTTFNPNVGTTISASGGERGYGSATDPANGDNSDVYVNGWGYAHESNGGVGSDGVDNYTGGGSTLLTRGGNGSGAKGGGSVNLIGQSVAGLNGPEISARGGPHFSARASQPVYPQEFTLKDGSTALSFNFQGGKGVQHSSGQAGTAENGLSYGGGGGGVAAEGGTNHSGSGASGVVILVYLDDGVGETTVTINDEDVRGLIGKASEAQSSFSEFYGAASGGIPVGNYPYTFYPADNPSPQLGLSQTPMKITNTTSSDIYVMKYNGSRTIRADTSMTDLLAIKQIIPYRDNYESILPRLGPGAGVYEGWRPEINIFSITNRVNLSVVQSIPSGTDPNTWGSAASFYFSINLHNENSNGGYTSSGDMIFGLQSQPNLQPNALGNIVFKLKWSNKEGVLSFPLSSSTSDSVAIQSYVWAPEVHYYQFRDAPTSNSTSVSGPVNYEGDRFADGDTGQDVTIEFSFNKA